MLKAFHLKCVSELVSGAQVEHLFGIRHAIRALAIQSFRNFSPPSFKGVGDTFGRLAAATTSAVMHLEHTSELRSTLEMLSKEYGTGAPRVLLVTATAVERDAVLRLSAAVVGSAATQEFGRCGYFRIGDIGGVTVFLVQAEMGSVSPGASLSTTLDAIDDIKPNAVIMVGIAFGVDENKQEIGEVLVSRQLQLYDPARIGTDKLGAEKIDSRGPKVPASAHILSRLRLADRDWPGKKIRYCVMLSGEKLVDNLDYRNELVKMYGDVEGGEMEGAGVYAAAIRRNVDWVLVKGICDWADGSKGKNKARRQKIAANQAASFVLRALQQGGFASMNKVVREM
jgi:nucleoside phosphorylase